MHLLALIILAYYIFDHIVPMANFVNNKTFDLCIVNSMSAWPV